MSTKVELPEMGKESRSGKGRGGRKGGGGGGGSPRRQSSGRGTEYIGIPRELYRALMQFARDRSVGYVRVTAPAVATKLIRTHLEEQGYWPPEGGGGQDGSDSS